MNRPMNSNLPEVHEYIERNCTNCILQNRSPERAFENLDSQLNRIHNSISNMMRTTTHKTNLVRLQRNSYQQQQKEMSSYQQQHRETFHTTASVRPVLTTTAPVRLKRHSSLQREISTVRRQCADIFRENQEIRIELAAQRRRIERLCDKYEEYHTGDLHHGIRGLCHNGGKLGRDDRSDLHRYREGLHNDREDLNNHAGAFHLNSGNVRNDARGLHHERGHFHHYDGELYFDEDIQTIVRKIHRLIHLL